MIKFESNRAKRRFNIVKLHKIVLNCLRDSVTFLQEFSIL